jgi:hypothetical protein
MELEIEEVRIKIQYLREQPHWNELVKKGTNTG